MVSLKNTLARISENSKIWENPTEKNQNTRPHFLTNQESWKNTRSLSSQN